MGRKSNVQIIHCLMDCVRTNVIVMENYVTLSIRFLGLFTMTASNKLRHTITNYSSYIFQGSYDMLSIIGQVINFVIQLI